MYLALGALGFISNVNIRWVHLFLTLLHCSDCSNVDDFLHVHETRERSTRLSHGFCPEVSEVSFSFSLRIPVSFLSALFDFVCVWLSPRAFAPFCFPSFSVKLRVTMLYCDTSSDELKEHNVGNPILELFLFVHRVFSWKYWSMTSNCGVLHSRVILLLRYCATILRPAGLNNTACGTSALEKSLRRPPPDVQTCSSGADHGGIIKRYRLPWCRP